MNEVNALASEDLETVAKTEPASAPDWRSELPNKFQSVAKKFPTPADVVKSYAALEKRLGKTVTIPDEQASASEVDSFYKRLGRPETPSEYSVKLPDQLPDSLTDSPDEFSIPDDFLAAMHSAGATPPVVQAAVDWYLQSLSEAEGIADRKASERRIAGETALRREWGEKFEGNVERAQRAAVHFGGNEFLTVLKEAKLDSHPAVLQALSKVGDTISEDNLMNGNESSGGANVLQRIDQLTTAHFGKSSYSSSSVQSELRGLYRQLYASSNN